MYKLLKWGLQISRLALVEMGSSTKFHEPVISKQVFLQKLSILHIFIIQLSIQKSFLNALNPIFKKNKDDAFAHALDISTAWVETAYK